MRAKDFRGDIKRPKVRDLASHFDRFAGPYLAEMGFRLTNDPGEVRGPYRATLAIYASPKGLFLAAGFAPMDGSYAAISAGRQWIVRGEWYGLSNSYCNLAKRFGLTVPEYYPMEGGEKFRNTLSAMLEDLKATLPIVLARVSLQDLLEVEAAKYGAQFRAMRAIGANAMDDVEVSTFTE